MDRWIMSRLHSLIRFVDTRLSALDITGAARAIESFTDELSNWYVRRSRERYWGGGMDDDKITAYLVLYEVLVTLARLIAPFTPFMAEMVYLNLVADHIEGAPESVHLCDFPEIDDAWIDPELEKNMDVAREIVTLGRAARNRAQIKIRQPLSELIAMGFDPLSDELSICVTDELNIQTLTFSDDDERLVDYEFKPQLRTLGRLMGKDLPKARPMIEALPGKATMAMLREKGYVEIDVDGTVYQLKEDDLLISVSAKGYVVEESANKVALDTMLTKT